MQIEEDLDTSTSCPCNSLIQDWELSLDIWISIERIESPVSDWDSNVVQAEGGNLLEVSLGDP